MADPTYPAPEDVAARRGTALVAGIAGLVLCAIGFAIDRDHFFRAYLIGYLFWLGVALGSLDEGAQLFGYATQNTSVAAIGLAARPVPMMSRMQPPRPVAAPPYGSIAEG